MRYALRNLIAVLLIAVPFGVAVAKLPPPTEAQKEAAAAKKEKAAAAAAKAKQELAAAQDRAVANYQANMKAKGGESHATAAAASEPKAPEHKAAKK